MLKVYRYEFKTKHSAINYSNGHYVGTGAYTCDNLPRKLQYKYDNLRNRMSDKHRGVTHPGARTDFENFNWEHYCGCGTKKKLENWFEGFNSELIELGFNLVEYHVKKRISSKSKKQFGFMVKDVINKIILK